LFDRFGERKQQLLVLALEGSNDIATAPLLLREDQRKEQGVQWLRKRDGQRRQGEDGEMREEVRVFKGSG
jgi:hypothetical protein